MLSFIILEAATGAGGAGMSSLLMIVLLIVIFYFFMIRPQSQKQKKINTFRSGLQKGDKVMTAGGIYGRIREVNEKNVLLEVSKDTVIRVDKGMIYQSAEEVSETGADPQNQK